MKFKIDENLHVECAELFRAHGIDAMTVLEQGMLSASDDEVERVCQVEERAIVTADLDFADARRAQIKSTAGLIILRLSDQAKVQQLAAIRRVIELLPTEAVSKRIWIVEHHRIRIRAFN